MSDAIKLAIEALGMAAIYNSANASNYNAALAALRAQPADSLKTAIRLVLDATPEQLPMAIDALRDLAIGEAME